MPGIGEVYYIANPGYGVTRSIAERPFPKAQREYDAIELTFDRRLANNWSLRASYTYSRLWGNYSGLANSDEQNTVGGGGRLSPNASRLFDVIQNTYDRNGKEVLGRLATDKPHQLKVFGTLRSRQLVCKRPQATASRLRSVISSTTRTPSMYLAPSATSASSAA